MINPLNKLMVSLHRFTLQVALILIALVINSCRQNPSIVYRARLIKAPVATMQLTPAIFVPKSFLEKNQIIEGDVVRLNTDNRQMEMRIYTHPGDSAFIAMHKDYRDSLNLQAGQVYVFRISKIGANERHLAPLSPELKIENYAGKVQSWHGFSLGAPHGDCDRETGKIVKLVSENYGIPSTAAYGARFSYRGRWFDVNRPLMKLPKEGGGTWPDRVWNKEALDLYNNYQRHIWQNNNLGQGERFKFYCSFHGHDLTVKMPDGKRIERPVIEAFGVGFTKKELRKIKSFYNAAKQTYYKNPPMLVFGNLPEDRTYYYKNIPMTFFYSGTGTRVYGALRSDLIEHGLHLETPNTMRLDPEVQTKTALFLNDLFVFVRDSILAPKEKTKRKKRLPKPYNISPRKITVSGGDFLMGAPKGVGWSAERPQHTVLVSPFKMDIYEVSNQQYAAFLNKAIFDKMISIKQGVVRSAQDTSKVWFRARSAAPMGSISFKKDAFVVAENRGSFPVVYVSWYGAKAYADYHDERLPTEAEWEKAASWDAGQKRKYLYAYKSNTVKEDKANFEDSGDVYENMMVLGTTPAGFFNVTSPAGLYDMSGNVFEWCSDWYEYGLYKNEPQQGWDNPQGPETGTMKTIRGGAWNHEPWITRTTFRLGVHPNATLVNLGFRCVK